MNTMIHVRRGGLRALPLVLSALWALLLFGGGAPLSGQTVRGEIVDKTTLAPVEGALAILRDTRGEEVDGALTNASGRFILRARGPGEYTILTERIGYESVTSPPFTLEPGQLMDIRLETAETAIQLEELRVEGEQQCVVRPEEGMEVARVWEEARKALTVQDWTDRQGIYRFQVVDYERELDPETRRVRSDSRRVTTAVTRSPIRSLPAEDLMENGFVRWQEDGGLEYFGPDATVLLSDLFLDTHCFRLELDEGSPGSVGLTFEPVRPGTIKDVTGTLWLDRETAGLRHLEYGYTWARYPEFRGFARGRVEFEGLPDGSWIIRRWWIRMPMLAQDLSRTRGSLTGVYLRGIKEVGGEIARISTLDRRRIAEGERGMVTGVVWDSTRYAPLEGARVFLSGTSYWATTNREGRFLIDRVPKGVFTTAFIHPRLDTLGIRDRGVEVDVTPGEVSDVSLGIPSQGRILEELCRGQERGWGTAVMAGTVRNAATGEAVPGATVRLSWQEVTRTGSGQLSAQEKWTELETDGEGRFLVCSVPAEELVTVQATFMDGKSDPRSVQLSSNSYAVVDLNVEILP